MPGKCRTKQSGSMLFLLYICHFWNSGGTIVDYNMFMTKLHGSHISLNLKGLPTFFIFFFTLCLCTNTAQAQIYASCTHRDYYMYDKNTEEFEYITGYDESSMFKINTKLTMFEHTTPDMTLFRKVNLTKKETH